MPAPSSGSASTAMAVHDRLYRYVKGRGRGRARDGGKESSEEQWTRPSKGGKRRDQRRASQVPGESMPTRSDSEAPEEYKRGPAAAGKATSLAADQDDDAAKKGGRARLSPQGHGHGRYAEGEVPAPGGPESVVAGRPSYVRPTRKRLVAREEQRPSDSAGMVSEADGINTNTQQANCIVGDALPKDGARKKKYRDFIHGSTADTLIFGHDMDNNRTEDVRDFTGAAGNRSSFSSDSEHFGRPPSDGGHLTLDDLREAGLTQTFKPRRKMECPHLDSLAGEIIQQQPEDAADTQYVSHAVFANAAGANSLRAAEAAAHQADVTSKPRRANRMGMNSSVDKVVFGIDLANSEADDHLENQLYSGYGSRSHSFVDPNDVSRRTTSALTDARVYGETKVVSSGGTGMEPTAAHDERDFEGAAGRSTATLARRVVGVRGPATGAGGMPSEGAGYPAAGGGATALAKQQQARVAQDIDAHGSKRATSPPARAREERPADQLIYSYGDDDGGVQRNAAAAGGSSPPQAVAARSRGHDDPTEPAAGVLTAVTSGASAAATRTTLIETDGRAGDARAARRADLVAPRAFDLINGESSDTAAQLHRAAAFEGGAGKSTVGMHAGTTIGASATNGNKGAAVRGSRRSAPLDLIKDPFEHKGAAPTMGFAKQLEYSKLYGSSVKEVVFPQSSGLPAPPISEGFAPDVAGLTSGHLHSIKGSGDAVARMEASSVRGDGPPEEVYGEAGRAGKRGSYTTMLPGYGPSRKAMVDTRVDNGYTGDVSGGSAQALIQRRSEPPATSPEARGKGERPTGKGTTVRAGAYDGASGDARRCTGIDYRMRTGALPIQRHNPVYASDVDEVVFGRDTDGDPSGYFDGRGMRPYDGAGVPCIALHRREADLARGRKGRVVSDGFMNASSVDVDSNVDNLTGVDATPDSMSGKMYEALEDARRGRKADLTTEAAFRGCGGSSSAALSLTAMLGDFNARMHFPPALVPGGVERVQGESSPPWIPSAEPSAAAEATTTSSGSFGAAGRTSGQLNSAAMHKFEAERVARGKGGKEGGLPSAGMAGMAGMAGVPSEMVTAVGDLRLGNVAHRKQQVPHSRGSLAQALLRGNDQAARTPSHAARLEERGNAEFAAHVASLQQRHGGGGHGRGGGSGGGGELRFSVGADGVHDAAPRTNPLATMMTHGDDSAKNARSRFQFESHLETSGASMGVMGGAVGFGGASAAPARAARRAPLLGRFHRAAGAKLSLESAKLQREEVLGRPQSAPPSQRSQQRSQRSHRNTPRSQRATPRATPRSQSPGRGGGGGGGGGAVAGKASGLKAQRQRRSTRENVGGYDGGSAAQALGGWFGGVAQALGGGGGGSRRSRSAGPATRGGDMRGGEGGVLALRAARDTTPFGSFGIGGGDDLGADSGGGGDRLQQRRSALTPADGGDMPTGGIGGGGGGGGGGDDGAYARALDAGRSLLGSPYTPVTRSESAPPARTSYLALTRARDPSSGAAGGFRKDDRSAGFGGGSFHRVSAPLAPPPFGVDTTTTAITTAASRFQTSSSAVGSHPWISGGVSVRPMHTRSGGSPGGGGFSPSASSSAIVPFAPAGRRF